VQVSRIAARMPANRQGETENAVSGEGRGGRGGEEWQIKRTLLVATTGYAGSLSLSLSNMSPSFYHSLFDRVLSLFNDPNVSSAPARSLSWLPRPGHIAVCIDTRGTATPMRKKREREREKETSMSIISSQLSSRKRRSEKNHVETRGEKPRGDGIIHGPASRFRSSSNEISMHAKGHGEGKGKGKRITARNG